MESDGAFRRLARRGRASLPSPAKTFGGAVLWGLLMSLSALFGLWLRDWQTASHYLPVALVFAAGGVIAFPLALFSARLFGLGRRHEAAFAATFIAFAVFTIGFTALAFAILYRSYYAEWHAPAFTITWIFQLVFTTASAIGQFAVLGTRLYFPLGFVALGAISAWIAMKMR